MAKSIKLLKRQISSFVLVPRSSGTNGFCKSLFNTSKNCFKITNLANHKFNNISNSLFSCKDNGASGTFASNDITSNKNVF